MRMYTKHYDLKWASQMHPPQHLDLSKRQPHMNLYDAICMGLYSCFAGFLGHKLCLETNTVISRDKHYSAHETYDCSFYLYLSFLNSASLRVCSSHIFWTLQRLRKPCLFSSFFSCPVYYILSFFPVYICIFSGYAFTLAWVCVNVFNTSLCL